MAILYIHLVESYQHIKIYHHECLLFFTQCTYPCRSGAVADGWGYFWAPPDTLIGRQPCPVVAIEGSAPAKDLINRPGPSKLSVACSCLCFSMGRAAPAWAARFSMCSTMLIGDFT